jgi:predicted nucleic acid-binding protein
MSSSSTTSIVIDANIAIAKIHPSPLSEKVIKQWDAWMETNIDIFVPQLFANEITTVLHKTFMQGTISEEDAFRELDTAFALELQFENQDIHLCKQAFVWASRLGQLAAYDGFYLALAERHQAEFWTSDQRLYNRAQQIGATWVHYIG